MFWCTSEVPDFEPFFLIASPLFSTSRDPPAEIATTNHLFCFPSFFLKGRMSPLGQNNSPKGKRPGGEMGRAGGPPLCLKLADPSSHHGSWGEYINPPLLQRKRPRSVFSRLGRNKGIGTKSPADWLNNSQQKPLGGLVPVVWRLCLGPAAVPDQPAENYREIRT